MSNARPESHEETPGEAAAPHPSVVTLARFLVRVFYGKVEVLGVEKVPRDRPLVFVANHPNSLVDPALLLAFMPETPRFLGTSELWDMPILRPFLKWAAAIPVYRRHVAGFDREKNQRTFARCHEVLAAGGHIGILPEGTSHSEPGLVPLRTGVSRIVLQAEERFGDLGIHIVPVGYTFEERTRFRSDALVLVGDPIDPAPQIAIYGESPRQAVTDLTARVRDSLIALTLNFPSWDEAELIERAAELHLRPQAESRAIPLSEEFVQRKAFNTGYKALQDKEPEIVDRMAGVVQRYDAALRRERVEDQDVAARYTLAQVARFSLRSLWLVLVRLPLGLIGLVIHFIPFQAASWAGRRLSGSTDRIATYKVIASMVFYCATWLIVAFVAGWQWGGWAALLALVAGPLCGGVALRLYLRSRYFWQRARAFFKLRRGRTATELRALRAAASSAVAELVERYESKHPASAAGR